ADVLSMLYLISATLKRYEDQGRIKEDLPLIRWAVRDMTYHAQEAIDGILSNFPLKWMATLLRFTIFPAGMSFRPPLDARNRDAAQLVLVPGAARERLTTGMLEAAFLATVACEPIDEKIRKGLKKGKMVARPGAELGVIALENNLITAEELTQWQRKEALRKGVIKVDDFPQDFGRAQALDADATRPFVRAA